MERRVSGDSPVSDAVAAYGPAQYPVDWALAQHARQVEEDDDADGNAKQPEK
jgi:hypothetical protein